jgi:hypothetical protein
MECLHFLKFLLFARMSGSLAYFNQVAADKLCDNTKDNYLRRQVTFQKWLLKHFSDQSCFVGDDLQIVNVTTAMLKQFIGEMSIWQVGKKKGQMKSHSTPEAYHAAILNLYKKYDASLPEGFKEVILKIHVDLKQLTLDVIF